MLDKHGSVIGRGEDKHMNETESLPQRRGCAQYYAVMVKTGKSGLLIIPWLVSCRDQHINISLQRASVWYISTCGVDCPVVTLEKEVINHLGNCLN
jgi:hypothetical protein